MIARILLVALLALLPISAEAANRFWVPAAVTGAVDNGSGLCRLTVPNNNGFATGLTVTVASVGGATGCNVTTTITVVDSTHIDLAGTTFGGTYTSGGTVAGARITTGNTANWASSSGTAGGQTVPGSGDAVTFDANSGGGIAVSDFGGTITWQSITCGQFGGTIDNTINNNNMTFTTSPWFNCSGTGSREFKAGTATYSASGSSGSLFNMGVVTNLANPTTSFANSTIVLTNSGASSATNATFSGGGLTFGTVTLNANISGFAVAGANTIATLNIAAPNYVYFSGTVTNTITSALNITGTSSSNIVGLASSLTSVATIARSGATIATLDWLNVRAITVTGGTISATNSRDLGTNSGFSLTPPTFSGGGKCIGCGL